LAGYPLAGLRFFQTHPIGVAKTVAAVLFARAGLARLGLVAVGKSKQRSRFQFQCLQLVTFFSFFIPRSNSIAHKLIKDTIKKLSYIPVAPTILIINNVVGSQAASVNHQFSNYHLNLT